MKHLLLTAAIFVLATAKPEGTYKETEDFQYSRSSSDDGTKSGYYGAQRGNTGGNYERAHNMDGLAQNQMNSLVSQVDGDLGDGSKMRAGNVYTSANSQGVYGSGRRYDYSHLGNRNFQDGERQGNFQSNLQTSQNGAYSGQSSSASHSSGYSSNVAQNSRSQSSNTAAQSSQSSNLESADQYNSGRNQHGYSSGSGYQSQSEYQGLYSNTNQQYTSDGVPIIRLVSGAPARVIIRPAGTVTIPVAAQRYDNSHSSSSHYDQNSINSEAEVLNNNNQQTSYRPSSNAKHYESSSSYRKQWERHYGQPVADVTVTPLPKNSELYDDSQISHTYRQNQAQGYNSHTAQSSNSNYRYDSNSQAAQNSESLQNSQYNTQQSSKSFDANTHGHVGSNYGATADGSNYANVDTNPKSYHSSYSYHKSWERQGEPYEIKLPGTNGNSEGLSSQRLTAESNRKGYSSNQYGSQYRQRYGSGCTIECDENGHIRVARSLKSDEQETQDVWANLEDLGQQSQNTWNGYTDLGQQAQSNWNNAGIEDLGQQTQNQWGNLEQQSQSQWSKFDDAGQQTQDKWDNLEQQSQLYQSEVSGQQTQNNWENMEQQSQPQWNGLDNVGQQTQNRWDNLEDLGQQTQNLGQQDQRTWNTQENGENSEKLEVLEQQSHNTWDQTELGQEVQSNWNTNKPNTWPYNQNNENPVAVGDEENFHHSQISQKDNEETYSHQVNVWDRVNGFESFNMNQNNNNDNKSDIFVQNNEKENFDQQSSWDQISQTSNKELEQNNQNLWSQTINDNTNSHMKPTWEQHVSNTHETSASGTDSTVFNNHSDMFWSHFNEQSHQTETDANHATQHTYSNWSANENSYSNHNVESETGSSLTSFWDKINKFDQESSMNTDNDNQNEYNFSHNSNSENVYHNWRDTQQFHNKSSESLPFMPWHLDNVRPSSTTTPKEDKEDTFEVEKLRPQDIGRGDIGADDLVSPGNTNITKNSNNTQQTLSNPKETNVPGFNRIESMSLSNENNKVTSHPNFNLETHNLNKISDNSEETLSVLGIKDQKQFEEQPPHITSTSTPTTSIYNNDSTEKKNLQTQHKYNKNELQTSSNYNRHLESKSILTDSNTERGFEQGVESEYTDKQSDWKNLQENSDKQLQTELGVQENLDQQSQASWGQDIVNLGQEIQTQFNSNSELQQDDTQQFEQFQGVNKNNYQSQDFYKDRYHNEKEQASKNVEFLPESSKNIEMPQVVPQNSEVEIIAPPEPTTEKPGFWKSVGNKFSSAKDTVSSWFKRS